ncbi:hypothetical protein BOTBODRAFT_48045 [Botryobasidium botryosum FD-172 SS1]|uniref:Uncharacterized protein n=1 Tax=Botryobasidium botryosum (strain FD-172 SS1) TaxID=930990 RepID=A0A067MAH6_BOTB1|nr:hypothetical protein BOTBODRAFT_48045 [Botryobasidium botryosum FD-172 SS1]
MPKQWPFNKEPADPSPDHVYARTGRSRLRPNFPTYASDSSDSSDSETIPDENEPAEEILDNMKEESAASSDDESLQGDVDETVNTLADAVTKSSLYDDRSCNVSNPISPRDGAASLPAAKAASPAFQSEPSGSKIKFRSGPRSPLGKARPMAHPTISVPGVFRFSRIQFEAHLVQKVASPLNSSTLPDLLWQTLRELLLGSIYLSLDSPILPSLAPSACPELERFQLTNTYFQSALPANLPRPKHFLYEMPLEIAQYTFALIIASPTVFLSLSLGNATVSTTSPPNADYVTCFPNLAAFTTSLVPSPHTREAPESPEAGQILLHVAFTAAKVSHFLAEFATIKTVTRLIGILVVSTESRLRPSLERLQIQSSDVGVETPVKLIWSRQTFGSPLMELEARA